MALTSCALSCWSGARAVGNIGQTTSVLFDAMRNDATSASTLMLAMIGNCLACRPCMLPPPPARGPGDETDDEFEDLEAYDGVILEGGSLTPGRARLHAKRDANRALVMWLAAAALLALVWDTWHGGVGLGMWVLIGAFAGALGAAGGVAVAAFATPRDEGDVEGMSEWVRNALQGGVLDGRNSTARLSIVGAACLAAATSGVCAWSVHEYEHDERATLLWLVNALLLGAFAVRHGFKVWRAGGCARGGRLRLMTRAGCGCRGCVWPALL